MLCQRLSDIDKFISLIIYIFNIQHIILQKKGYICVNLRFGSNSNTANMKIIYRKRNESKKAIFENLY